MRARLNTVTAAEPKAIIQFNCTVFDAATTGLFLG
jgi:hypothetical protein